MTIYVCTSQYAHGEENQFDSLYKDTASKYDSISWKLLKAIAMVESGENPLKINKADPSYGLMQIHCTGDSRQFPGLSDTKWSVVTKEELMDPVINVEIASALLDWNIRHYGPLRGIGVYNCWAARHSPECGPFPNQEYVIKVLVALTEITEDEYSNDKILS